MGREPVESSGTMGCCSSLFFYELCLCGSVQPASLACSYLGT